MRIIWKLDFNFVSGFPFGKSADSTKSCTKVCGKMVVPNIVHLEW